MMKTLEPFQRSVKIQYHRDAASGGGRAKLTIPARIRREAAVEAGSFMEWAEQRGKIVGIPVLTPSLRTTAVYHGGRDQLFCLFPGVFWKKYQFRKGTEFYWTLEGKQVRGYIPIPKRTQRSVRAYDKSLELSHSVYLLRHQHRYRINILAAFRQALKLNAGHFFRWQEIDGAIRCTPVREESMETTKIIVRQAGTQVEIPQFLCDKYDLFGKSCLWTLQKGVLTGTIQCRASFAEKE